VPFTVTARVSLLLDTAMPEDCDPRTAVPVDDAACEAWVTSMVWDPRLRPLPDASDANPYWAPPWERRKLGLESTMVEVEETEPAEMSELAAASCFTRNCTEPTGVPAAAVAVATVESELVAWRTFHPEFCDNVDAAVCSATRSLLMAW